MSAAHTPVLEFHGYVVTPEGEVFSVASNWRGYGLRKMAVTPNADGYPSVRLTRHGRRVRMALHRIVAQAFLPPRPEGQEVRHMDGDKNNPHVSNLAWGTQADNAADRERHGRTSRGEAHSIAIRRAIGTLEAGL